MDTESVKQQVSNAVDEMDKRMAEINELLMEINKQLEEKIKR